MQDPDVAVCYPSNSDRIFRQAKNFQHSKKVPLCISTSGDRLLYHALITHRKAIMRTSPNIIITGTPGVGKSTHCEQLAQAVEGMKHLDVNKVVKERQCEDGYDEDLKSVIVDEDKVCGS